MSNVIAPERRIPTIHPEHRDSLGFGKFTDGQLRAIIQIIKDRNLLSEPPPEDAEGRGIVVCGGGKYLDFAWVNARWLRHQNIELPIQVWHLGPKEMPSWARKHFSKLDVELVDAFQVREKHWHRKLIGWSAKQYAAMRTKFREVIVYDADCFATAHPNVIFDDPDFQETGAVFFRDVNVCRSSNWPFFFAKMRVPECEFDSGLFAWDRVKAWTGIKWTNWIAEHSENWDTMLHGDKDRPLIGFGTSKTPYVLAEKVTWEGWGIGQWWRGNLIAKHAMAYKRGEANAPDPLIPSFFEEWRSLT